MVTIKLKYVDHFYDRHSKERAYFRAPGGNRTPLPLPVGSQAFLDAYHAALAECPKGERKKPTKAGYKPRSLSHLIVEYRKSARYQAIKDSTKGAYHGPLQWLADRYGEQPISDLTRADVIRIQGRKASDGNAASNTVIKVLRILVAHAIDLGWRVTDPTLRVKKMPEGEHSAWTAEEHAQFEARWPVGTPERLGYALALFTGQRRGDVAGMTWADVDPLKRSVRVVQEKTGTKLAIPLHRDLWATLEAYPRDKVALMATTRGGRYTTESFGNMMADAIRAAGLPRHCKLHGLRKSAGARLAEVGCSTREIMAVLGHRSLSQAEHYTKQAQQVKLARSAMDKMEQGR
jgi:enterobacteria phage integrase